MNRRRPAFDLWAPLIALLILCWCVNTCGGQQSQFRGLPTGGWRASSSGVGIYAGVTTGRKRCYIDGVEVNCETGTPKHQVVPRVQTAQPAIQNAPSKAIVRIETPTASGGRAGGSGVIAELRTHGGVRIGVVLTCRHILKGSVNETVIILYDGSRHPVTSMRTAATHDFAVLTFRAPKPIHVYPLANRAPQVGESVWWAGHPHGQYKQQFGTIVEISNGMIYASLQDPGRPGRLGALDRFNEIDGASGGPLLSTSGDVVGIVSEFTFITDTGADRRIGGMNAAWIKDFITLPPDTAPMVLPGPAANLPVPDENTAVDEKPAEKPLTPVRPPGRCYFIPDSYWETIAKVRLTHAEIEENLVSDREHLVRIDEAIEKINVTIKHLVETCTAQPPLPPQAGLYAVLVVDKESSTWSWLGPKADKVAHQFSLRIVEAPADHSFGALPQLVFYRDGTPVARYAGASDVYAQLSRLRAGREPSL